MAKKGTSINNYEIKSSDEEFLDFGVLSVSGLAKFGQGH
jgi:hypothetical protein